MPCPKRREDQTASAPSRRHGKTRHEFLAAEGHFSAQGPCRHLGALLQTRVGRMHPRTSSCRATRKVERDAAVIGQHHTHELSGRTSLATTNAGPLRPSRRSSPPRSGRRRRYCCPPGGGFSELWLHLHLHGLSFSHPRKLRTPRRLRLTEVTARRVAGSPRSISAVWRPYAPPTTRLFHARGNDLRHRVPPWPF